MSAPAHCARPSRLALALALALTLPGMASAQTPARPDAKTRMAELDATQVIANVEDPQSTTGSAYLLTEYELEKFDRTNINNVLRSVPGVYTREESGQGVFPRIGIRASSAGRSDRISVLEDGIPAAMAPYANTSAYFFPNMGRMRAVEVLKGPEILLHGPQTTSGVVNLLSSLIPEERGGEVKAEIGSFGARKLQANYGATAGQWGFLLETYQSEGDGFHEVDRSDLGAGHEINEYLGKLRWTSAADATYAQQIDIKLNYDVEVARVSYLGLSDADFRHNPNRRYGLSELERMDRGRKSASVQHQFGFDEDTWLTTTLYYADTYRDYNRLNQINGINIGGVTRILNQQLTDAELIAGILHGTHDTTHANGVRYGHNHQAFTTRGIQTQFQHGFDTGSLRHELSVGARWNEDTTRNARDGLQNSFYQQINGDLVFQRTAFTSPQRGGADAWSVWAADRIRVGQWNLLPIVRHEHIRTRANLARNATAEQYAARKTNKLSKTTAGFGFNYEANAHWTVLGGVHQGFAPPGGNAARGTKGEESTNYEGGVRYRNGDFGLDAIGFFTDYENSIRTCLVANPCSGGVVEGTEQTGAKEVYGLELGLFGQLYAGDGFSLPVRLAYTLTDGEYTRDSDLGNGVRKNDVLEYTPKHIGSLQFGLETDQGWRAYAALNYAGHSYTSNDAGRDGVDDRFLRTDRLFTVDLSASVPLTRSAEFYARVENVFDQQKITHRGADGARGNAPRAYGIGLRLKY